MWPRERKRSRKAQTKLTALSLLHDNAKQDRAALLPCATLSWLWRMAFSRAGPGFTSWRSSPLITPDVGLTTPLVHACMKGEPNSRKPIFSYRRASSEFDSCIGAVYGETVAGSNRKPLNLQQYCTNELDGYPEIAGSQDSQPAT